MKKIAITPRIEYLDEQWKYFVNESYLTALHHPSLTCMLALDGKDADRFAQECDGLLLPGGYDIAPFYFHQNLEEHATLYQRPVDQIDFLYLNAFVKAKKPILGICRGIQLINIYFHGTLNQHIPVSAHEVNKHEHPIQYKDHTPFQQLLYPEQMVNSFHHQAIERLGEHLAIGATAADGHIEAIYHEQLPIIAVQWHPEKLDDDLIIPYFIDMLLRT